MLFAACQSKDGTSSNSTMTDTTKYAYTLKKSYDWKMNLDPNNLQVALNALKAFENLDTTTLQKFVADSIWLHVDGYKFKGTKNQFIKEAQHEMDKYKSIKINMDDMESVISKDKTEEWVSLWYDQISTLKDGKIDTMSVYNDIKIKNNKVAVWSEYVQHPMKK